MAREGSLGGRGEATSCVSKKVGEVLPLYYVSPFSRACIYSYSMFIFIFTYA